MVTEETKWGRVEKDDMPRWDAELGVMKGSIKNKARKLNKLGCIEEISLGVYRIKPIQGYNKTEYTVSIGSNNPFEINYLAVESCNCQFNKNGKGKTCAHIMAVHLYRKLKGE